MSSLKYRAEIHIILVTRLYTALFNMQFVNEIYFLFNAAIPVSLTVEQDVINEGEMIMDVCVSINPGSVALLTNGFVNYFLSTSPNTATGIQHTDVHTFTL